MSAARHGAKIEEQNIRDTETARQGVAMGTPTLEGAQGGAANYAFPAKFSAATKRDQIVRMKQELMNEDGMSKFGRVMMTDQDVKWLLDKQKATEEANFQAWFADQFNTSDVATRTWAQKVNPEFYNQREKMLLDKVKLATRIKLIELRGPQNEEDLITLYGLRTGRLKLEPGWDKVGLSFGPGQLTAAEKTKQQANFREGLLRPYAYPNQATRSANAKESPFGGPEPAASPFMNQTSNAPWASFLQDVTGHSGNAGYGLFGPPF